MWFSDQSSPIGSGSQPPQFLPDNPPESGKPYYGVVCVSLQSGELMLYVSNHDSSNVAGRRGEAFYFLNLMKIMCDGSIPTWVDP